MAPSLRRIPGIVCLTISVTISGCAGPVLAERGHGYERGRFYSPHWELDIRHGHDHYYPARGYLLPGLPPGYLDLTFGGGHFFFRSGVWYRAQGPAFVVVSSPVGIRLGFLPPSYNTIWIGGMPYYYANGIYYTPVPNTSEYAVVDPPPGYDTAISQPTPAQASSPPPPTPVGPQIALPTPLPTPLPSSLFVYLRDGQSKSQITAARSECNVWAVDQTGHDPAHAGAGNPQRVSAFQQAVKTSLEGKGYTVN